MKLLVFKPQRQRSFQPAFTIAEVMITFTIFSLLVSVIVGSLLVVFRSHRYIFGVLESQSSLRFVLETMTREIKEGNNFSFNSQDKTISFRNKDGQMVEYFWEMEKIFRRQGGEVMPITSENLRVVRFDVAGCWQSHSCQPSLTLLLQVQPRIGPSGDIFYLQTTITQRRVGI